MIAPLVVLVTVDLLVCCWYNPQCWVLVSLLPTRLSGAFQQCWWTVPSPGHCRHLVHPRYRTAHSSFLHSMELLQAPLIRSCWVAARPLALLSVGPSADLMGVLCVSPPAHWEETKKGKSQDRLLRDSAYPWPLGSFLDLRILCRGISRVESYLDIGEADEEDVGQESLETRYLREWSCDYGWISEELSRQNKPYNGWVYLDVNKW